MFVYACREDWMSYSYVEVCGRSRGIYSIKVVNAYALS